MPEGATALRLVIADDEATARRRLRRLLSALEDVEIVGEVDGGRALLERIARGDVDVALVDVQMPDLSGLEAAAQMPEGRPYVVFTTAHAEHAVPAFDVGAADYVLKPIELDRLRTALERARRALEPRAEREPPSRLAVPTARGVVLVAVDAIRCVIWDGQLSVIHADREVLSEESLTEIASRLPAHRFVRAHRRALLNLDHVALFEPLATGGYRAHTRDGLHVPVSRQAARQLRKQLGIR